MPFKKRLGRWQEDLKHQLGLSSQNMDTSLLQSSPSPESRILPGIEAPPIIAPVPSVQARPVCDAVSPSTTATPAHPITASTDPTSKTLLDVLPPTSTASPSLRNMVAPNAQEPGLLRPKATTWTGLKKLLKLLEASSDAFGPLRSAIGELNRCIDIYEGAAKGRQDYDNLRVRLDSLLDDLSQFLGGATASTMTTSVKNLCNCIEKELELVKGKQDRGATRRYDEALGDSEQILDCYRRIGGHIERLTLNANLRIWKLVDEQATDARLDRLSPAHAAVYDSSKSSVVQRGPCTLGTRKGELIKLQGWARNGDSNYISWMNGMAGTGKTTIAYSLCQELERTGELGASFFCSRSIPECRKVELILPSIAYQLARFSRPFRSALTQVLESDPDVHQRALDKQFSSLIAKPLLGTQNTMPLAVVVVIDALDECENENAIGQILEILLVGGQAARLPIRFLISSRPEPEIYSRMMERVGKDSNARLVLHELDATTVNRDIKTYLEAELKNVPLTTPQLAALVEHCGVLFIYASTAARYIKAGVRLRKHEERLNMILGLSPASANGRDRDIDILYASILHTAFQNKDFDESDLAGVKMILHTVICAQEPMSIGGLAGLLGLADSEQVDALLRPLGSVLNITETSGLVTTLHASFPEFMLNKARSSTFHCDLQSNHGRLAKACFEAIAKQDPQFNICGLKSSYNRDDEVTDLKEHVNRVVSAQLFYACQYWVAHLELSDPLMNLQELMHDFLSIRLLLWMEVLNLKKSMGLGARVMQRAERWSRSNGCSKETTELAHDAWRFITMFAGHAISQSTPHIYVSMLPFWPESTPMAEHYAKQTRGVIKARGTAMSRRQLALLATWAFNNVPQSACFSPDGSLIAFGSSSSVYVIDGTTGRTVVGPLDHEDLVTSVTFSPNGALIASGSADKTIRIWNVQSGQTVVGPLTGHTGAIDSVSFSPDNMRIVSGSNDETVRVWDLQTEHTVVGPLQCGALSHSVCFSPDGTRILSTSWGYMLRAWDAQHGRMVIGFRGHTDSVISACYSPANTCIASGSQDNTIRIWSAHDGKIIGDPLEGHSDIILSVAFSPDGKYIASGSNDRTIRLWDLSNEPPRILEGHTSPVTSVGFSSDGSRIVSCSDDKTIRVWDARSRATLVDSLEGHTGAITSVGFSPDGKCILSGSYDETIRMWDSQGGKMVGNPLEGHSDWVRSVCFSPDGMRMVSGSEDGTIRVWDIQSGHVVMAPLEGHRTSVFSVGFSSDGSLIISGSLDNTIQLWDAQNGKPVGDPMKGHTGGVNSVGFSADTTRVVSGSDDTTIRVWDIQSGENAVGPLKGHSGHVLSVCFSPDGTRIVSCSEDKTIRVWSSHNGEMVFAPLTGHTDMARSVCFSPDGTLIVSGSYDKTVRLWDAQTGRAVGDSLVGHTGRVGSVAFSPNGMHIVSGSEDQTIRVWEVRGILGMQQAADRIEAPVLRSCSNYSWVLRGDGWVVGSQSRLLAWVPPDLHTALLRPCNPFLISTQGSFQLEFDSANLGESWSGCYHPSSR